MEPNDKAGETPKAGETAPKAGGPTNEAKAEPSTSGASTADSGAAKKATGEPAKPATPPAESKPAATPTATPTPSASTPPPAKPAEIKAADVPATDSESLEVIKKSLKEIQAYNEDKKLREQQKADADKAKAEAPAPAPQQPSIGRIVHFTPKEDSFEAAGGATTVAAIIVSVGDKGSVNLKVFNDGPDNTWISGVEFNEKNKAGSWNWPART